MQTISEKEIIKYIKSLQKYFEILNNNLINRPSIINTPFILYDWYQQKIGNLTPTHVHNLWSLSLFIDIVQRDTKIAIEWKPTTNNNDVNLPSNISFEDSNKKDKLNF